MQGAHHVAQKFKSSNLPPKFDAVIVRPLSAVMEKSGAESPSCTMCSRRVRKITHTSAHTSAPIETCKIRSVLPLSIVTNLYFYCNLPPVGGITDLDADHETCRVLGFARLPQSVAVGE